MRAIFWMVTGATVEWVAQHSEILKNFLKTFGG